MSNPSNMPLTRKISNKPDPVKRRGRAFGLGERNPETLPGSGPKAETVDQNREGTLHWRRIGKLSAAGRFIGSKY